jgi:hypothetical protein
MRTAAVQRNYTLHYLGPIQPSNPLPGFTNKPVF